MKNCQNKWVRAAIPALLLHFSIGTVYCWSIFSQEIADYIGFSKAATEWAFSFAIFFLGMSAAFLGNVVEKDIHKSSLIATITFALGMAGTGFFIYYGGGTIREAFSPWWAFMYATALSWASVSERVIFPR